MGNLMNALMLQQLDASSAASDGFSLVRFCCFMLLVLVLSFSHLMSIRVSSRKHMGIEPLDELTT